MLIDRFGRRHTSLRISVTDRCNLRCTYCMPAETPQYQPRADLLTFEEITRFVRIAVDLGVNDVRLTGGEPLVRRQLDRLVASLTAIEGIEKVGLTTNGILLAEQISSLHAAGLPSVNVSLDALDESSFQSITRRSGLTRVLAGITAAQELGVAVKINAIARRGFTEDQIDAFGQFTREANIPVRFIEFMPLDSDDDWQRSGVLTAAELLSRFRERFGPLHPVDRPTGDAAPATDYRFADGRGMIGVIPSVSQPFCNTCNRFRLTADGQLRNCLFGNDSGDVRALLRGDGDDREIAATLTHAIAIKKAGHGSDDLSFVRPNRPMHAIGG